jgi:MFS family permease
MFYGWRMVGLVSAIRILGGGLHNYGFTVFFLPLSQDLGLSRAATSLAFSLARAEGAIEGPFVGYLIDRFGPRPMILVATIDAG